MAYAGQFMERTMKAGDKRDVTARYIADPSAAVEPDNNQSMKVEEILRSRWYKGRYQYEIQCEGIDDSFWHDADTLTCIDLIEEYESSI